MNTEIKKKAKADFEKYIFKMMNMPFLKKLRKMSENMKVSSLQQPKKEGII